MKSDRSSQYNSNWPFSMNKCLHGSDQLTYSRDKLIPHCESDIRIHFNDGQGPLFTAEEHFKLSITNLLNLVSQFEGVFDYKVWEVVPTRRSRNCLQLSVVYCFISSIPRVIRNQIMATMNVHHDGMVGVGVTEQWVDGFIDVVSRTS